MSFYLELEEGRQAGFKVYYMAKIISLERNQYKVSVLQRSSKFGCRDRFCFPVIEDIGKITKDKLKGVLSQVTGTTQRLAGIIRFEPPLTNYNVR